MVNCANLGAASLLLDPNDTGHPNREWDRDRDLKSLALRFVVYGKQNNVNDSPTTGTNLGLLLCFLSAQCAQAQGTTGDYAILRKKCFQEF